MLAQVFSQCTQFDSFLPQNLEIRAILHKEINNKSDSDYKCITPKILRRGAEAAGASLELSLGNIINLKLQGRVKYLFVPNLQCCSFHFYFQTLGKLGFFAFYWVKCILFPRNNWKLPGEPLQEDKVLTLWTLRGQEEVTACSHRSSLGSFWVFPFVPHTLEREAEARTNTLWASDGKEDFIFVTQPQGHTQMEAGGIASKFKKAVSHWWFLRWGQESEPSGNVHRTLSLPSSQPHAGRPWCHQDFCPLVPRHFLLLCLLLCCFLTEDSSSWSTKIRVLPVLGGRCHNRASVLPKLSEHHQDWHWWLYLN